MRFALFLALISAPAVAQVPTPGPLRTFGDWTVGCDNGRACQANALVPASDDRDRYLLLVVTRDAAGPAPAKLLVPFDPKPTGAAMLLVDGKVVARPVPTGADGGATLPLDRALTTALANGQSVALGNGRVPPVASASLKGLAAALLYMDEQQLRLGTIGALRRPGPKPDTTVPAAVLPTIRRPARGTGAPRNLTVAAAAKAIGREAANCDYALSPLKPRAHRLDARHSVVLVDHPCGNGAYNLFTSVYVLDQAGRATPARFDAPVGMSEDSDNEVVNGDWDEQTATLTSFTKARGIGDCGTSQSFAWDGTRFRLTEQTEMAECRGSIDYITTWRAMTR